MTQQEFFKRYTYSPSRDRIGGGGFGTVYKAKDNLLHRTVAIKVSEVKTTADGKKTFSLKDEFEALNHVPKHPNIANYEEFYSFESPQGLFDYAVMQYYPDGNLGNAIKRGLTDEQKEDIATQLLEGIDFLHKHKVVHRDLKPGNILIVKDDDRIIPLITDFGLSKATGMGENSVFSNSFGAGTPKYSSPEQLQGNPLRFNTDLWSYGAILYELLTGEQLFSAGSGAANTAQADMEVYNKIVNGNVSGLSKMPEKWRKVAERCLVVDAGKRAKDAGELFAIIKGNDDETEVTNGPIVSPHSIPSSDSGRSSHSEMGAGGSKTPSHTNDKPNTKKGLWIGLGIAAAVIVTLLLLLKPKQESAPTDLEEQAYEACQTVADYRAYISDYGQNSMHYADAKAFVDHYVADSIEQSVQDSLARVQAQAEAEEEEAYKKCTSIMGCNAYLKAYPQGRYVKEVKQKKEDFEIAEAEAALELLPESLKNQTAFTFFFSEDSDDISDKSSVNDKVDNAILDYVKTYSINGFEIRGWILPTELEGTAENRANAVANHIMAVIKKSKVVFNYSFKIKVGIDWNRLIATIENSDIRDKDAILNNIQKSSDKERTFWECYDILPQLENALPPSSFRRVEVSVY